MTLDINLRIRSVPLASVVSISHKVYARHLVVCNFTFSLLMQIEKSKKKRKTKTKKTKKQEDYVCKKDGAVEKED